MNKKDLNIVKYLLIITAMFFFLFAYASLLYNNTGSFFVEFIMLIVGFGAFVSLFTALAYIIQKITQK